MVQRQRMTRDSRRVLLIDLARSIISTCGADALTLGFLAERGGVSKPVVYSHFASRPALLLALYEEFDLRQTAALNDALVSTPASLRERIQAISKSIVACALAQGSELPGVLAALVGNPELEKVRSRSRDAYVQTCREALEQLPGSDGLTDAAGIAFFGAAEAVSLAAVQGALSTPDAQRQIEIVLYAVIQQPAPD